MTCILKSVKEATLLKIKRKKSITYSQKATASAIKLIYKPLHQGLNSSPKIQFVIQNLIVFRKKRLIELF